MNALLVHADNLNPDLIKNFPGNEVAFDYSQSIQNANFVLDHFLHERLLESLKNEGYNVIFIPYTLSQQNYLELTGLRVAAHIRVTKDFNHQFVPIVFIGSETREQIAKLSDLGNILFTPGIFSTQKFDVDSYSKQYDWILENKPKITETELNKCFERLKIAPPANYQSHHSIDNELALLRWSEYIGCSEKISEVKENIKTSLYFKYHQALNPCPLIQDRKNFLLSGVGNILLIDDEAKKGWKDFYKHFFQNNINNKTIEFDYLNIDFKSITNQSEIVEKAKEKVREYNPDVVLLDLRLCDQDFLENVNPKALTGIKILKKIKEINKGIQVIVTTASNKSWNYQTALSFGADGYLVKQGNSDVKEDIRNLKELIEKSLKRAKFLKPVYQKISEIKEFINENERFDSKDDNIRKTLYSNLEISFELLSKATSSDDHKKYFNYAFLQLFLCIEEFLSINSVFKYGDKCYVDNNIKAAEKIAENKWKSAIKYYREETSYWSYEENEEVKNIGTDFKMSAVLIFLFDKETSDYGNWPVIRDVRNKKAAHPDIGIIEQEEIKQILDFMKYIFNVNNFKRSIKKGLMDDIGGDDINKQKEKFGSK